MEEILQHNLVKSQGLHIIADFFDCQSGKHLMLDAEQLKMMCQQAVRDVVLTEVNCIFHQFPMGGVTGVVLLAESHLSIHTWPENDHLTLDVFVCNYCNDNTSKAIILLESFIEVFKPDKTSQHNIKRG